MTGIRSLNRHLRTVTKILNLKDRLRGYTETHFYFLELLFRLRGQWTSWDCKS